MKKLNDCKYEIIFENDYRKMIKLNEKNKKGEGLIIEVSCCYYDNKSKNSLPNLWKKNGYTERLYNSALWIDCEIINKNDDHFRGYEPTSKLSEDKKRRVIDFDWLLEVSKENEEKILNETLKRFFQAKKEV